MKTLWVSLSACISVFLACWMALSSVHYGEWFGVLIFIPIIVGGCCVGCLIVRWLDY